MQTNPIGVFDSGMGGLTVLSALRSVMPNESFIYLGDTARLPYGTKSKETVRQYATQMANLLLQRDIKALVIACNTASTAARDHLQALCTDLPVIGVVEPGAEAAVAATRNHQVYVMATETTIVSGAYQACIKKAMPDAQVQAVPSGLLVALAEEGMVNNDIAKATLKHYLSDLKQEDTLLLGCTHFPVFKPALASILPEGVQVVDSADVTAAYTKQLLSEQNLLNSTHSEPKYQYLVTDSIQRFETIGERFLGEALNHHGIEQVDV